jgi:hypothetical protein
MASKDRINTDDLVSGGLIFFFGGYIYTEYKFLIALIFTIIIETVVLFLVIRGLLRIDAKKIPGRLLLFSGFLASFSTLPYLWFILPSFIASYFYLVIVGELSVTIMESAIYYFLLRTTVKNALIISSLCNLASFLLGLIYL